MLAGRISRAGVAKSLVVAAVRTANGFTNAMLGKSPASEVLGAGCSPKRSADNSGCFGPVSGPQERVVR